MYSLYTKLELGLMKYISVIIIALGGCVATIFLTKISVVGPIIMFIVTMVAVHDISIVVSEDCSPTSDKSKESAYTEPEADL